MDLVVDANVLFSALLKNGITAELLSRSDIHLFSPEFIFEEFQKYEKELLKRTERTIEDFQSLMTGLRRKIHIVSYTEILSFVEHAEKSSPDEKDTVYIALSLKLQCPVWSNDKALKEKQNIVKVLHTHDLLRILEIT